MALRRRQRRPMHSGVVLETSLFDPGLLLLLPFQFFVQTSIMVDTSSAKFFLFSRVLRGEFGLVAVLARGHAPKKHFQCVGFQFESDCESRRQSVQTRVLKHLWHYC